MGRVWVGGEDGGEDGVAGGWMRWGGSKKKREKRNLVESDLLPADGVEDLILALGIPGVGRDGGAQWAGEGRGWRVGGRAGEAHGVHRGKMLRQCPARARVGHTTREG